jgi:aspartokinase
MYWNHIFPLHCFLKITLQVAVIPNCSILAAVGQKMASTHGVSATLFNALAKVKSFIYIYIYIYIYMYVCIEMSSLDAQRLYTFNIMSSYLFIFAIFF